MAISSTLKTPGSINFTGAKAKSAHPSPKNGVQADTIKDMTSFSPKGTVKFEQVLSHYLYQKNEAAIKKQIAIRLSALSGHALKPMHVDIAHIETIFNSPEFRKNWQEGLQKRLKENGNYQQAFQKTSTEELAEIQETLSHAVIMPESSEKPQQTSVKFGAKIEDPDDPGPSRSDFLRNPSQAMQRLATRTTNAAANTFLNEARQKQAAEFLEGTANKFLNEDRQKQVSDFLTGAAKASVDDILSDKYQKDVRKRVGKVVDNLIADNQPKIVKAAQQTVRETLTGLVDDSIYPFLQITAGLASVPIGHLQQSETARTATHAIGGYHLAAGTHKLLGTGHSDVYKMALGGTSLLASYLFLPAFLHMPAKILGVSSLVSGLMQKNNTSGKDQLQIGAAATGAGLLAKLLWMGNTPLLAGLATLGNGLVNYWHEAKGTNRANQTANRVSAPTTSSASTSSSSHSSSQASSSRTPSNQVNTWSDLDINKVDNQGKTALHHALSRRDTEKVKQLLLMGDKILPSLNKADNSGYTPLHLAGSSAMVEMLLSTGDKILPSLNKVNKFGNTPLHSAIYSRKRESAEIIKLFLSMGRHIEPSINKANDSGQTPLHIAVEELNGDALEALLSSDYIEPSINKVDKWGKTPLYLAAEMGNYNAVKLICSTNYNIDSTSFNTTNKDGKTIFHHVSYPDPLPLKLILSKARGHNIVSALNKRDKNGKTPLDHARKTIFDFGDDVYWETRKLLRQAGARG